MVLELPFNRDPLEAAASVSTRPGTLLLHGGRAWDRSARSYLLFDPRWTLWADSGGKLHWRGAVPTSSPPSVDLLELPRYLSECLDGDDPYPWLAGVLGFEAGSRTHGSRHPVAPPFRLDEARLSAYDRMLVFGPDQTPTLVVRSLGNMESAGPRLEERAAAAADRLERSIPPPARQRPTTGPTEFFDRTDHARAIETIQKHLRAGDTYQINLTGFAYARTDRDAWPVFLREVASNPTAFAAYLRLDDATITSHSPERLLHLRGDRAETAPIKGTATSDELEALRSSAKDRAEHVMIVDLCRNDLGRHARAGSVRVVELMETLRMRGLVHLVTRVQAEIPATARAGLLASLFPGGSITGAPKHRACEIIREVESSGRGPYTGSIGYVTPNGDMDWNIAIRTAVWQDQRVSFGCGGGIVLDSDPDREYEEAQLKARSFFESLAAGPAREHRNEAP